MDANEIRKWHKIFYPEGGLFEIRLLHGKNNANWSGYFEDVEVMIKALEPLLADTFRNGNPQTYFTLNKLPEALYSREQHDKFVWKAATTTDSDIERRKFVLIDLDPDRPANISSSAEELARAKTKAGKIYKFLKGQGFKEPVVALSGNGYHLIYKADMPNDGSHSELVKTFLESLDQMFSGDGVKIDTSVATAARICKLYGTEARKGTSTKERPWRLAKMLYVPEKFEGNDVSLFSDVALLMPKKQVSAPQRNSYNYDGEGFDIEKWLTEHGLEYRIKHNSVFTIYQLRKCPWEDSHSSHHEWDSAIFKRDDGQLSFSCWHDHCKGKTWRDVRLLYEPDAYSHPYQQRYSQPARQTTKPEIKSENETLGKKWLRPMDVKKVDLYKLPKVKTGFRELDRYIKGLHFFEYTVVSGINGSGKSSWLNTLILNLLDEGTRVALWSGELPVASLLTWIDLAAAGSNHLKTGFDSEGDPYYYVSDEISNKIRTWYGDNFLVFNDAYGNKWEQLFSDMKELLPQGFRIFILDNLSAMDIDIIDGDKNKREQTVVEELHKFCITNKCHIILVVHPRKGTARGQRSMLRKGDIAGSGAITNLADNVFIIHRNNEDFRKGLAEFYGKTEAEKYEYRNEYGDVGNVMEICKNRMYGNQDHIVRFYFDRMSRRFKSTPDENIEYGWNTDALAKEGSLNLDNKQNNNDNGLPFSQATDEAPF